VTTTRPRHQRATPPASRAHRRLPPDDRRRAARPPRLTGERPRRGATPDSLLALHDAGYLAVLERLERLERPERPGPVRVLDVGCGEGFEPLRLAGGGRQVLAVDYAREATEAARRLAHDGAAASGPSLAPRPAFSVAQMDALALGIAGGVFDAVCSSHLVEHFADPSGHVAELARVTSDTGTAFFLTPNITCDFENPFHLHLFGPDDLGALLGASFEDVWVGGLDATERVKADFAARRAKAAGLLRLDVLDLRHRIPRSWYVALYTRLLPIAYALMARGASGGASSFTSDDWFVTDDVDETTLVLFAACRRPRRPNLERDARARP
jgi:SAM-dependent methyltransferase